MPDVVTYPGPAAFLGRAEAWLLEREDLHNLVLSIAYAGALAGERNSDAFWATVEVAGDVAGCAIRTPPHKLLVTDMPLEAAEPLVRAVANEYEAIPAVLGPAPVASEIASAWVAYRGGGWRPGMAHRIYRLDEVEHPVEVRGRMRIATEGDVPLAVTWADGFARDTGMGFSAPEEAVARWVEQGSLFVWEHEERPVSIAVAQGRTPRGARVGYVYTPPELRGRGYASACVAALSQRLLESGLEFAVLYTDLANPTSNAIYQRLGYAPIGDVGDFDVLTEGAT